MKSCFLILSSFVLISAATAASKSDHKAHHDHSKSLGAHEHGAIKLEIAVSGKTIEIDLDGPAESFIGFEYIAKTAKEKKAFQDAEFLWKTDLLSKLFILDEKLGCTSSEVSFQQELEEETKSNSKKESGVHSDIEAKATIVCTQNLSGKNVLVSLRKFYPHIKKLSIDVIGSETKSYQSKLTENIKL